MYLAAFYKIRFEKYLFNAKKLAPYGAPALIWGIAMVILSCLVILAPTI